MECDVIAVQKILNSEGDGYLVFQHPRRRLRAVNVHQSDQDRQWEGAWTCVHVGE